MADKTLYDVLEVGSDAAPECIRATYLDLHRRAAGAHEERRALEEAYRVLSNLAHRRKYDESLRLKALQALASSSVPQPLFPRVLVLTTLLLAGGVHFYFEAVEEIDRRRVAEDAAAQRRAHASMEEARAERERIRLRDRVLADVEPAAEVFALPPSQAAR